MQTSHRILTPEQCRKIVENLDECIAMFGTKTGILNGAEIRAKTLLSILRDEIAKKANEDSLSVFD